MKFRKILALNLAEADVSLIVLCATCGARSNSVFMSGTADTDHRSRRSSSREIVGYSTSVRLRARTHTVLGSYISSTSMFFWKKTHTVQYRACQDSNKRHPRRLQDALKKRSRPPKKPPRQPKKPQRRMKPIPRLAPRLAPKTHEVDPKSPETLLIRYSLTFIYEHEDPYKS